MSGAARSGVCVVGSIHMDVVAVASRLPARGESLVGERAALSPGGKAGNQAAQAALNGARTFMIGRVGRDAFGAQLREALQRAGVDTTHLSDDPDEGTGISPVLTGADGEYASIIVPGAGWRLGEAELTAAREAFAQSAVLLLQCEIPLEVSAGAARMGRAAGLTVILNASPVPADAGVVPADLWPNVDVLLLNATEAGLLSGEAVTDAAGALRAMVALRQRLGVPTVIVTLGGEGVVALQGDAARHQPTWPVPVVETIGAGDAFAGALASEFARGRSLADALPVANAAGALAVTRPGARESLPTGDEIAAFLRERGVTEAQVLEV
ncbi:MAG: ribokinase [Thermomicrobiales bacterium]